MSKTYIITGANGFLGNNIIRQLQTEDINIRALILKGTEIEPLNDLKCEIFYGDILDKNSLTKIFDVDDEIIVIHCAAMVYIKSKYSQKVFDINVTGTKNIAEKCLERNAKLIYINSVHAIPETGKILSEINKFNQKNVTGLYAKTKAIAANLILNMVNNKNLNAVIIQPSGIIGPYDFGETHMTKLIKSLAENKLPAIIDGGYDFVDVRDVASGIINSIANGVKGNSYILANRFVEIKEIAQIVCDYVGIKKIPIVLPIEPIKLITPICELYYNIKKETPLFTKYSLETTATGVSFNHEKAVQYLGYKTRDIKETIIDTINWINERKQGGFI